MTDKERFDACIALANYGAGRHDGRRDYEWKVTLGLWALVAGATIYHDRWSARLSSCTLAVICAAIFITYGYMWLFRLWIANANNQAFGSHYLDEAEAVLTASKGTVVAFDSKTASASLETFLQDWSMRFQLAGTFLLLVVLFIVSTR